MFEVEKVILFFDEIHSMPMKNSTIETNFVLRLLEASSDAIISAGKEGNIISWNKGAKTFLDTQKNKQ